MKPLRIAYLMEDTDLSGGVRVQLAQADALIDRGHAVTIVTKGLPLTWRRSQAEWQYVERFEEIDPGPFDFIFATFWTTLAPAHQIAGLKALHLCQGYEGSFPAYADIKREIDASYSLPIPKLIVAPNLEPVCRSFVDDVAYIGQIVDEEFFRSGPSAEHDPLRVLLAGASHIDSKGIDAGYGAVQHARWSGAKLDLIRVSPWAPAQDEPLDQVNEFHTALNTTAMVRLLHSCDLFIGSCRKEEGFGLPAAEALAASVPSVLTSIPSYRSFGSPHDYALFGREDDPEDLGDKLFEIAGDSSLRHTLRRRGREVAEQFRSDKTGERLEAELIRRLG